MSGAVQKCSVCGSEKPATFVYFRESRGMTTGLRKQCRICELAQRREYRKTKKVKGAYNGRGIQRILVLSDVHVPEHDRKVWQTSLAIARDLRPHEVVLLGDFLEMASCSQHGGAELEKLTEDFMAGRMALKEIREAVGSDCRITYLEGNHESRLTRFLMSKAPQLRDSLSFQVGLTLDQLDVDWISEAKQPITRGDLDLTHGHQDLRERPSKYHGGKMADVYGRPGRAVLYGHTHKPQVYTRPTVGGHATAVGLGCARSLAPGWLHGAQAGWVHQIALVYLTPAGRSHIYPITFTHGQTVLNGKLYGAVTEEEKK